MAAVGDHGDCGGWDDLDESAVFVAEVDVVVAPNDVGRWKVRERVGDRSEELGEAFEAFHSQDRAAGADAFAGFQVVLVDLGVGSRRHCCRETGAPGILLDEEFLT